MEETSQSQASQTRLLKFLRIYPDELGIFVILGVVFFCNAFATQIASVAAVSGFLKGNGVSQIPIVWIIDMFIILFVAGLQSSVIDRFERTKLLKIMILGFAVIFFILRILFYLNEPNWFSYGTMLIISDQQWLFFPLVFWTLAQDIFSVAQAKRLFSPIASFGFIGQVTGLLTVAIAPSLLDRFGIAVEELLFFNVVVYLIAYFFVAIGLKRIQAEPNIIRVERKPATLLEGWDFVKEIPVFKYLAICILAVTISLTFVEFGFLVITQQAFSSNYQAFYGFYRLGLMITSFVLQGLVTSRLLAKITLKNAFLLMPLALFVGSVWMLFTGTLSAIGGMVLPKLAQFTADDSARRSFQSLVPEERRGRVSMFLESTLFSVGVVIASLVILFALFLSTWIGALNASYVYRFLAVASGLWAIWAAIKMRLVYDQSMLNWRLKRRERSTSILDKLKF